MSESTAPQVLSVRAELNQKYFLKFLVIGLICLAGMGWFLYDGFIGYPARFAPSEAYYADDSFIEEPAKWRETAEANGWSTKVPATKEDIENEIFGQFVCAGIALLLAIPFIAKYLTALGSYIEATPQEIKPSWKKIVVPIEKVTKVDKHKWAEKGVAKVYYGENQKFVMDDFKFEREPMAQIMKWIETGLTDDQIVGGKREDAKTEDATVESVPAASDELAAK